MATTQSVISRLSEGGGARDRLDALTRGREAPTARLVVSIPVNLADAVLVALRLTL
jgi:hypothetical protein